MRRLAPVLLFLAGCSILNGLDEAPKDAPPADGAVADVFERIDGELPPDVEVVGVFPAVPSRDLDVLFLIDDSASMIVHQTLLAQSFPAFIAALEATEGGLPNVHIGIASSDVGVAPYTISNNCAGEGDDGALQHAPMVAGCTPPDGAYISYARDAAGTVTQNFTTSLAETFSCIAQLGAMGCGFERHFESMKRALDGHNAENAGFVRDGAYLAVIFLADEDDCSAADPEIYDPNPALDTMDSALGPLSSFRCSEFGILCEGMPIGRTQRELDPDGDPVLCEAQGAMLAGEPGYLWHPQHYVDFLKSLKPNPALVMVAAITGDPDPVSIIADPQGRPTLGPSCENADRSAVAGIRFRGLLDQFPARNVFTSICNDDLTGGLGEIGAMVANALGQSCLVGPLADRSSDPGLQPECRVWDVTAYGQPGESRGEIPACGSPPAGTCYGLEADAVSCPYDTHLRVAVTREGPALEEVTVVVECRRP